MHEAAYPWLERYANAPAQPTEEKSNRESEAHDQSRVSVLAVVKRGVTPEPVTILGVTEPIQ
jgi:hypothetical protein